MRGFDGQLTGLSLNGTQGIVWTLTGFYIKAYFSVIERARGIFQGVVE